MQNEHGSTSMFSGTKTQFLAAASGKTIVNIYVLPIQICFFVKIHIAILQKSG